MKKIIVFAFSILIFSFSSCAVSKGRIQKMQQLEEGVKNPTTIDEYIVAIKKYEKRVEDVYIANERIGVWYKILGSKYIDQKMWGEALKCYQKAVEYYPENQNLYYYIGVCAGYMSHTALDYDATGSSSKKLNYLRLAESAYIRSIEIDPKYVRSLYGIGVLYVFELNDFEKGIQYLETILPLDANHIDARFALARAYYVYYGKSGADKVIDLYDYILKNTKDSEKKASAERLKKQVLDELYVQ